MPSVLFQFVESTDNPLTVTAEAAGSSPVVPAIPSRVYERLPRTAWEQKGRDSAFRIASFGVAVDRFASIANEQRTAVGDWKALEKVQTELLVKDNPLMLFLREYFDSSPDKAEFVGAASEIACSVNAQLGTHINARSMGQKIAVLWPILEQEFGA